MNNIIPETEKKENKRSREWVFILYPESAAEDWKDQLIDLKIAFVISPIHDRDVNADGEPKKAHYHILLSFSSVKSFTQVKAITDLLNQPIPQICNSKKGQVRYFIHLDNPEKYQYAREDIEVYGGLDIEDYFKLSVNDELNLVDDILDYCEVNDITEFYQLVDYVRKNNRDWFRYINKNTYLIMSYLKNNHLHKKEERMKVLTSGTPTEKLIQQLEDTL